MRLPRAKAEAHGPLSLGPDPVRWWTSPLTRAYPGFPHELSTDPFHGKKGDLYQRYHDGMEDQLGALGLVLNCVVLWNTVYMNAALDQLRATGRLVLDADVVRLSPFVRRHLGVHGDYSFLLPELAGNLRELRDPHSDAAEED
jgi:hypothetical protein